MALSFGQSKDDDVATLISRRQYAKAIEVIKAQLQRGAPDPRLRLQLADALVFAGRDREAVMILLPLADEYAKEGFAAKAISVLKKIQKIDPGRRDIDTKLAALIETKQRLALTQPFVPPPAMPELGMEELGSEPSAGPRAVPAGPSPAAFALGSDEAAAAEALPASGDELDLGLAPDAAQAGPAPPTTVRRVPVTDRALLADDDGLAEFALDPIEPLLEGDALELEPAEEESPLAVDPDTGKPSVDAAFTSELLAVIDDLFPSGLAEPVASPEAESLAEGAQIVVSPLFKDFSVDEMVAVIQGLKLLTFEPRKVILRQGDPGDSLYVLTSGRVRAFVRNAEGKQTPLADLDEGAFFGEMSILTGKPRSATVVAATRCELLELDRATLDDIVARHPRVRDVLQEFAQQRSRHH